MHRDMCFWSIGLAALLVVEEHRIYNEDAEEQDERFQDAHHLHLAATTNDRIERVLLNEAMSTREAKGEILQQATSISLERCVCVNMD